MKDPYTENRKTLMRELTKTQINRKLAFRGLGRINAGGFAGGSNSKESTCNAGDPGSIPGLERCPGEGHGYPLQYSCWRIPGTEEPGGLQSLGSQRVRHNWATNRHTQSHQVDSIQVLSKLQWIVHRNRKHNPSVCLKPQKTPNGQSHPQKEEQSWRHHMSWFQTILQSYRNQNNMVLA